MWTRKAARLSLGVSVVLLSLLLTLNRFHTWFWYFHCWLWTSWVENVSVWIINIMNVRFQDKVQSGQKPFICFYLFCLIAYVNQISSMLKYVQNLNKNIHFVCEIRRSCPINSVKNLFRMVKLTEKHLRRHFRSPGNIYLFKVN